MTNATLVHTAIAGSVTAQVMRTPGRCRDDYTIVIHGVGPTSQHDEARRQAEMFIAYQEQIARMAWCPSCGE